MSSFRPFKISKREHEILENISLGFTVNEIAKVMFLSPHTIISHKRSLLQKLDVSNSAGMVRKAIEKGILVIPMPVITELSA